MKTTYYTVQILDEGFPKNVPHTGKKQCEFLSRTQAVKFLNNLIEKNPDYKFRLLKRIEEYQPEKWMQCLPKQKYDERKDI